MEMNKIYNMDCRDALAKIPDNCFDLIITDPPWSEKVHVGMRTTIGNEIKSSIDFKSTTFEELQEIYKEFPRICKGWVISFMDYSHIVKFEEIGCPGLDFIRFGIWYKPNAMRQVSADRPATGWEGICFLHNSKNKKEWNGGGRLGVFVCNNVTAGRFAANYHPCEKPIQLIIDLINLFSDPGDRILDPFCGSGTIPLACLMTGREYMGFEISEDYFKICEQRLSPWKEQKRLAIT